MLAHRRFGGLDVSADDRVADPFVDLGHGKSAVRRVKVVRRPAGNHVGAAVDHEAEHAVPGHLRDHDMEPLTHDLKCAVVRECGIARGLEVGAQPLGILRRPPRGRHRRRGGFQRQANLEQLPVRGVDALVVQGGDLRELADVRVEYHRAAPRPRLELDEAERLEDPQRFTERTAADLVTLHHFCFGFQDRTRRQLILDDMRHYLSGDRVSDLLNPASHLSPSRVGLVRQQTVIMITVFTVMVALLRNDARSYSAVRLLRPTWRPSIVGAIRLAVRLVPRARACHQSRVA